MEYVNGIRDTWEKNLQNIGYPGQFPSLPHPSSPSPCEASPSQVLSLPTDREAGRNECLPGEFVSEQGSAHGNFIFKTTMGSSTIAQPVASNYS